MGGGCHGRPLPYADPLRHRRGYSGSLGRILDACVLAAMVVGDYLRRTALRHQVQRVAA